MPKMKSNRGAYKRFKVTGGGKIKMWRSTGSHLLTKKTTKRKRRLRKPKLASAADTKRLKTMILK